MNKTLVCVGMALLLACPLFAKEDTDLKTSVQRSVSAVKRTNQGAIDNNLRVDFEISESFYDERSELDYGPYRADIACKAYPLDSHWLILSGTCMRYSNGDIFEPGDHEFIERYGRTVKNNINYKRGYSTILIWTKDAQYKAPFVNILATSSPNQLFTLSADHTIKINTARHGRDAVKTRKLKTGSVSGNYFKLDESWTDLSGTATDPLFVVSPQGNEFLAGFNNGYITYALQITIDDFFNTFKGKTSDEWFSLDQSDLEFIKATVQEKRPQDWARIKTRLFFNTTDKPFFSK